MEQELRNLLLREARASRDLPNRDLVIEINEHFSEIEYHDLRRIVC